ncbi:hypothetical protein CONPUDRAFT_89135 [Coniophora puteana RWD-64-598 SS2]|uniref:DUF6534 domain-containing protein n=1 Tax=Coniophora puteana (strain RWD-64-598) TaxID=741705 RepID=A0A5M3MVJ7_CONPW|nr:uncharacterized protein CONPUDRAFT_89135 [Coniophora puteana RWD-64-598 SS2]EIW83156.1 hypothetical protein CONPUDRAFT_89135 [Coniophora puteana RWD-64-598 SS2]
MGDYDLTVGTLIIGIFFNTYLYGLVSHQFAAYYQAGYDDGKLVKYVQKLDLLELTHTRVDRLMILFLFLLDTFHSGAVIYMAWYYAVTNYNNPDVLSIELWPYMFTPIGTALSALLTQTFLAVRIWRFGRSRVLIGIIGALAVPCFVLGMACGIKAWNIKYMAQMVSITNLATAWLVSQVTVDTIVTGVMTYMLSRSRTGFQKTDNVINRLIRGAVQTGLFAGIFSLGDMITFLLWPETNLYGMFAIPIGRIYTNTLLDTLLSRHDLRDQMTGTINMDSMSAWGHGSSRNSRTITSRQLTELEVRKEVEVVTDNRSLSCASSDGKATLTV